MPPVPKIPPRVGRTVTAYPTPLIEDTIEVEVVDAVAGLYHPAKFGTRYSQVEHGAFAKELENYLLCADVAADNEGRLRKRTWVSPRVDQEQYNFAISYEANQLDFPTYTRSYVFEREGYSPLDLLSPDPIDPFAFLVAEQVLEAIDPPELRNVFIKVVRIYMTLPGPISYVIEYPYGGDPSSPRITTKQKDAHQAFAQAVGTKCPVENFSGASLVAQTIQQSELWAVDIVQRIYDIVPVVDYGAPGSNGFHEDGADYHGQEKYGYSVGYMLGMRAYPFLTWKFAIGINDYLPASDLAPCPIKGFENLRLVNQQAEGDEKQTLLLHITRRYETLPGPLVHKVDYENNDPGFPIVSSTQRVAVSDYSIGTPGTTLCQVPGFTNLILSEQHLIPADFGTVREDQRICEILPGSKVVSYDYDSTVNTIVQTIRQKALAGTFPFLDLLTLEYREKPIDRYRSVQIQSRLLQLPPTRVEFKTVNNWAFPTLLTGIAITKVGLVANRNEVSWFPNTLRPIQNVPAILRVTTSYHNQVPPPETIFVLPTRNIVYSGISFQLSISNVLCDAISLSVSFASDTKYGGLQEAVSFAATNPSATQYYQVIGQYRVIACDISIWRAGIWTKTVSEVVLV
jgi:hypothetical protein